MAKLEGAKPCPFCGEDSINLDVIDGALRAWCVNCSAVGPSMDFGPDGTAAGAWNDTRANEMDGQDDAHIEGYLSALDVLESLLRQAPKLVERADVLLLIKNMRDDMDAEPNDHILGE